MYKKYNMKIIPFLLLSLLILPDSIIPVCKTDAYPIIYAYDAETNITSDAQESNYFHQNITDLPPLLSKPFLESNVITAVGGSDPPQLNVITTLNYSTPRFNTTDRT
jgi:hypothetical protein